MGEEQWADEDHRSSSSRVRRGLEQGEHGGRGHGGRTRSSRTTRRPGSSTSAARAPDALIEAGRSFRNAIPGLPRHTRARARRGRHGRVPRDDLGHAGGRAVRLPADRPEDARLGRQLLQDARRPDLRALGPVRRALDDAAARSRARAAAGCVGRAAEFGDPMRAVGESRRQHRANKAVYARMVEEVVNKGNFDVVDEIFHPDYVDHAAPPGITARPRGREGDLLDVPHRLPGREVHDRPDGRRGRLRRDARPRRGDAHRPVHRRFRRAASTRSGGRSASSASRTGRSASTGASPTCSGCSSRSASSRLRTRRAQPEPWRHSCRHERRREPQPDPSFLRRGLDENDLDVYDELVTRTSSTTKRCPGSRRAARASRC